MDDDAQEEHRQDLMRLRGSSFHIAVGKRDVLDHIFDVTLKHNLKAMWITRTDPRLLRRDRPGDYDILWLSASDAKDGCFQAHTLDSMENHVKSFLGNNQGVIVLERLDYLINRYGFVDVMNTLYSINDRVRDSDSFFVICLNPSVLKPEQSSMLIQEFPHIPEVEHGTDLLRRYDLYETLRFIGEHEGTSSKELHSTLGVTRTTARKRLYQLQEMGFVRIMKDGRTNHLMLTDKGRATPR